MRGAALTIAVLGACASADAKDFAEKYNKTHGFHKYKDGWLTRATCQDPRCAGFDSYTQCVQNLGEEHCETLYAVSKHKFIKRYDYGGYDSDYPCGTYYPKGAFYKPWTWKYYKYAKYGYYTGDCKKDKKNHTLAATAHKFVGLQPIEKIDTFQAIGPNANINGNGTNGNGTNGSSTFAAYPDSLPLPNVMLGSESGYQCTCTCDAEENSIGCISFVLDQNGLVKQWTLAQQEQIGSVSSGVQAYRDFLQGAYLNVFYPSRGKKFIGTSSVVQQPYANPLPLSNPALAPTNGYIPNQDMFYGSMQESEAGKAYKTTYMLTASYTNLAGNGTNATNGNATNGTFNPFGFETPQMIPFIERVKFGDTTCNAPKNVRVNCATYCQVVVGDVLDRENAADDFINKCKVKGMNGTLARELSPFLNANGELNP